MPASAFAAIVDAFSSISLADVGIGAAFGGLTSAVTGGNPLIGALEGGAGGALGDIGSFELSGTGIGNALSSAESGVSGFLNDAGTGIENFLGFGTGAPGTAGGTALDAATTDATNALGNTGGALPGAAPVSAVPSSGGFESPTSLLSGQDQSVLNQLGANSTSTAIPGSTTPNATNLGNLGNLGQNVSTSVADTGASSGELEAGTGSNFGGGSPGSGGSSLPGQLNTSLTSGGSPDAFGVPGGVATTNLTGASSVADTSSSGLGDQVSGFFNKASNLKYALPAGELINTLIQGPQKLPSNARALEAGGAVEGPLQQTETQSLNAYNTGTLTAPQQAQIDQYTQQQTSALYQQLAEQGVTNPHKDSRFIQGMQQIQQQAEIMKQQLLGQDLSAGEGAAGQAAQDLMATADLQNKSDEDYQNAINEAVQSFSSMAGGNSISSIAKLLGA